MYGDPDRLLYGIILMAAFFMIALLNLGGTFKSRKRRRYFIIASLSGVISGAAFWVPQLHLSFLQVYDGLRSLIGVLSFITMMSFLGMVVVDFATHRD